MDFVSNADLLKASFRPGTYIGQIWFIFLFHPGLNMYVAAQDRYAISQRMD